MKKTYLLIYILFSSLVLISCDNSKNDKIVIWHDKEDAVIEVIKEILTNELPDIQVDFLRRESLTDSLKLVGNSPSAAPDMYMFAHDKIGFFSEIGILEPITNLIDEDIFSDFVPLTIAATTYKGKIYQLPIYYETLLFMYNKDRMSEDEVPETTEDLYQYMKDKTDARRYAFVEQHSSAYYSVGWIHGFGGQILTEDGEPKLNDPKTIEALTYHYKFLEYMPKGQAEYATVNTMFYEKRANSIIGGPWIVPLAKDNGIDLGFAPMPIVNETGIPLSPYAGIQGIHVLKVAANNSLKREKIVQILKVLSKREVGINLALEIGAAPAHNEAYIDERVTNNELVMAMKRAAENAIAMPNRPEMDIMWLTAADMLVAININNKNIIESANAAQERSIELINAMK